MAYEANNAADAETAYRKHWRSLLEEFQISSLPSSKLRSLGIANESHELRFRKHFGLLLRTWDSNWFCFSGRLRALH